MTDHYLSSAKRALGIKDGGPKKDQTLETDMLLQSVHGYTRAQMLQQVRSERHKYTLQHHENIRGELLKGANNRLRSSAAAHLNDGHVEDLVKYAKAHDFLDHGKMRLDEAVGVARTYRKVGTVSPKEYEGEVFYKKKKKDDSHDVHGGH